MSVCEINSKSSQEERAYEAKHNSSGPTELLLRWRLCESKHRPDRILGLSRTFTLLCPISHLQFLPANKALGLFLKLARAVREFTIPVLLARFESLLQIYFRAADLQHHRA